MSKTAHEWLRDWCRRQVEAGKPATVLDVIDQMARQLPPEIILQLFIEQQRGDCLYQVWCRDDRTCECGPPGNYILATRRLFTHAEAVAYAKTVAASREPVVLMTGTRAEGANAKNTA